MAWVKMQTKNGTVISVPETLYNSLYKGNEAYSLVSEPKPTPKKETKKEEIIKDGIQKSDINANYNTRKSGKKAVE